jgi:ankyrin repeat protein
MQSPSNLTVGVSLDYKIASIVPEAAVENQMTLLTAIKENDMEEVMRIADKKYIDVPDFSGQSPLIAAMTYKHFDIARVLLVYGANPNVRSGVNGVTALMLCGGNDDMQLAELLLDKGANINAVVLQKGSRTEGYNALHFATMHMATGVVEVLMRRGVDSRAVSADGKDVIQIMRDTLITGSSLLSIANRDKQHKAYAEMSYLIEGLRNDLELGQKEL